MNEKRNQFRDNAFMLVELIAVMTIIVLLATLAMPLARNQIIRSREAQLRDDLFMMRQAIDRYKDYTDRGLIPTKIETLGYPPDLKTLVDGVPVKAPGKGKCKFLRKIPVDPMTGNADWGLRAMQDDPGSTGWGGQDVYDVYSKSQETALNGTRYTEW